MTSEPTPSANADSPLEWADDGQPRSRLYGDVYFSTADGLAETRAVFLQGCGLPDAWRGRRWFVVGELGFGTGLNILALLDLWRSEGPADGRLHVFTVEAHPIAADEAARALARWPELADLAQMLTARWPGRSRGVHRIELPELRAIIDVAILDVAEALAGWTGRADAWFLDGFSPALNPQMWRDEVLALVAQRSAPGARAATFTVAGQVRRGLAAAGFAVDKRPGFGRKRERLEAVAPGAVADRSGAAAVAILGAGVAGASAARAVRALGGEPVVFDPAGPASGASGNPAALVTPRLDAGLGPPAELFAEAFRRAVRLYEEAPEAVISRGVLQLATGPRDADRFARIAASNFFEPGALAVLAEGLAQQSALVVDPAAVLPEWAGEVRREQVAAIAGDDDGWRLLDASGETLAHARAVIVAAGLASQDFAELRLQGVRGQASWVEGVTLAHAVAWGGYAAPTRSGVLFGATHDRDDLASETREADHARNLATLEAALPDLAAEVRGRTIAGRAGVRATTQDRLPLAGPAPGQDGLFLLTGFGSRGFSLAPWLAEHVAALALGAPSPLRISLTPLVDPERFHKRDLARAR